MEDLDPNVRFGWTSGRSWVNDWWRENQLSEDGARTFLELIRGWQTYRGDRELLGLAIRRLAASALESWKIRDGRPASGFRHRS